MAVEYAGVESDIGYGDAGQMLVLGGNFIREKLSKVENQSNRDDCRM